MDKRRQNPPNARFWIWYKDGRVKLTLKPGQFVEFAHGHPTEEGFHFEAHSYEHMWDHVQSEVYTSSRDCDGPLETSRTFTCALEYLKGQEAGDGFMVPCWDRTHASQRDHFAETAGY